MDQISTSEQSLFFNVEINLRCRPVFDYLLAVQFHFQFRLCKALFGSSDYLDNFLRHLRFSFDFDSVRIVPLGLVASRPLAVLCRSACQGHGVPLRMRRTNPEYLDLDRSLPADILLREEPEDEEEEDEENTTAAKTKMGTKATRSEWLQWVKDEARTFRQGSRGDVGLAPTGISHTHPQRRCFGGGFAPEPAIPEAGGTRAAASGRLSWRAHHQEEHIRLAERTRSHRSVSEEY